MKTHIRRSLATVLPVLALGVLVAPRAALSQTGDPGPLVSVDWVASHAADPSVVVLDAETRKARYDEGHIPGAHFLDMNGLMWDGDPPVRAELRTPATIDSTLEAAGVSDGQHIVVYATSPLVAMRAWMTLDVMGLGDHASVLDGDFSAWQADGRPVSKDDPSVTKGSVTLHPRADVVVDSDWILHRLDDPSLTILDARAYDQYTGEQGLRDLHRGHIPGAYSLPWEKFVEAQSMPRMRSRDELAGLVRASGAADGSTVAVYCVIGMRASFDYFVARMLGYDVKFYDGSWTDWSLKGLPTVMGASRR